MAAQDFRNAIQEDLEPVSDFVCHLESTFLIAYGQDAMSNDTKDTLLYLDLMKAPAVSGATKYQELCVAAINKKKRLDDSRKQLQYHRLSPPQSQQLHRSKFQQPSVPLATQQKPFQPDQLSDGRRFPQATLSSDGKKCFQCRKSGHIMHDCPLKRTESSGQAVGLGPSRCHLWKDQMTSQL